jgi:hypothetical protein
MTGRSLHDSLLKVVSDGSLRARLLKGDRQVSAPLGEQEAAVLARLPAERVARISRFLARHYYRERIIRLFRHARRLAAHTGRDPLAVLESPSGLTFLDDAVLGSADSADRLLSLIETYLTENDEAIVARAPYWRDLIRYQAAMVRVEATHDSRQQPPQSRRPRCSTAVQILTLEWDIPMVLAALREGDSLPTGRAARTSLLMARSRHGRVTSVRCTEVIRRLLEAADGNRDVEELARTCRLAPEDADRLVRQLSEMGALA